MLAKTTKYSYILLERENMDYNGTNILMRQIKNVNSDLFTNKKDYIIEDKVEVLTVHIKKSKIYFENIEIHTN